MTKLQELARQGQAIWLDYIRRSFITSGELKALIDIGLRGLTSNPTIFEKAIAGSTDYDEDLHRMVDEGKSVEEIYESLVLEDIQQVAHLLRPVYDSTKGKDGYVSLEVSPSLSHDTEGTLKEARRLFKKLNQPNVMIKVPATHEGIPAIETLISEGINVNVTLIFSLSQYEAVADAYIRGLVVRASSGEDISHITSVASFFVSRVDTAVDRELEKIEKKELQGKIAVANAKKAYSRFKEFFSGARWERLAQMGGQVQRPLWASTGTKNSAYSDVLYVEELVGLDTVNTLPPATLNSFLDHGIVSSTLETGMEKIEDQLSRLSEVGIDLDQITQKLLGDGLDSFSKSFETLMKSISAKRDHLLSGFEHQSAHLGSYQSHVDSALEEMTENKILSRIWAHDHTVWKPEDTEITNRLGWLHSPEVMQESLHDLEELAKDILKDGYTHGLLLGMGGSSLAPELFSKTFGERDGHLNLSVLDSTDPGAVRFYSENLDPSRTLFIVSTKSGKTVETLSFFKFFYNRVLEAVGAERAGDHFIAITDPGSSLETLAVEYKFRKTFLNDPNIGGRYSALSHFGLVPAVLVGVDVHHLLDRSMTAASGCESSVNARENPGTWLGAIMGELAKKGRDKVTLISSEGIASFGDWVEQLIAESTGKEGLGILPVVGEPLGPPHVYGDDRIFVHIRMDKDDTYDSGIQALQDAGHPVVSLRLHDPYDVGGQFFKWEMATAVAGSRLRINPFDQPNVESAKVLARKMVEEYKKKGELPEETPALIVDGISVYGDVKGDKPDKSLEDFLKGAKPGDYVALQAYLEPSKEIYTVLQEFRIKIRDQFRLATTLGFGPRFLHSTGQLHKGDGGKGFFIQFTADDANDLPIPDEPGSKKSSMTFGVLKMAQALGDRRALLDNNRRILRFHLGKDILTGLKKISTRIYAD
jgi:transaldolase/glucose-6-phosphate isomerase